MIHLKCFSLQKCSHAFFSRLTDTHRCSFPTSSCKRAAESLLFLKRHVPFDCVCVVFRAAADSLLNRTVTQKPSGFKIINYLNAQRLVRNCSIKS